MTTGTETKAEAEVRQAADAFYEALNAMLEGDIGPMEEVWSHEDYVTLMGPFGGRWVGWNDVRTEFKQEAQMHLHGRVEARDLLVRAQGDYGYTICDERGETMSIAGRPTVIDHRATNIYKRENGRWKLIHHHTDEAPALQEATGGGNI